VYFLSDPPEVRRAAYQPWHAQGKLFSSPELTLFLGPNPRHIQQVPGPLFRTVKRQQGKADHASPSNVEVNWVEVYLHSPYIMPSWRS
jgi:hypothetical protein